MNNNKIDTLDRKIGMPDIEKEWAKFKKEVINIKPSTKKQNQ